MQEKEELLATISMIEKLNNKLDIQNKALNEAVQVAVFDERFRFVEANNNYCKLLGRSFFDIKNKPLKGFLNKNYSKIFTNEVKRAMKNNESWQGELGLLKEDKSKIYVDAVFVPSENDIGDKNIFSIQFDITQKKHYEAELEKKNKELVRLNQLKNKLFSIVSHDFRSPLKTLQGTLQLAVKGAISTEELKLYTENILSKVDRTAEFLDNLLNWAKSQMTGARVKPGKVNIKIVADEVVELIRPQADKKQIYVKNLLKDAQVVADAEMIKLVLRNLLSNAIKFTREKGNIRIESKMLNKTLQVAVKDNGVGIDSNQLKKLFDLENYTTSGTANELGMGLGLILCKDFIERNKGEIWVRSKKEKGSAFYFTLPLLDEKRQLRIDPTDETIN